MCATVSWGAHESFMHPIFVLKNGCDTTRCHKVPTYAKYLRDILNNKRPLPITEVIKLTEECSAAILNTSPIKKKHLGCPTIDCSIRNQNIENALCNLGASVSVIPKKVFDKHNFSTLTLTSMCLQLAD
jgi:hypothetical protein